MKRDSRPFRVLIVDDEREYREVLRLILAEEGYLAETAASGFEALSKLKMVPFDLVLTDLMMAGMDGVELLKNIKKSQRRVDVIIITGYGTIENAVEAMKKGAYSYFIKGNDPVDLMKEINEIRNGKGAEHEQKSGQKSEFDLAQFVLETKNKQFKRVLDIAGRAAESNVNILILGETGVGKDVLAQFIHEHSGRARMRFVPVNCQAYAEGLLESELFGHEKGAFTGALERRKGRFEAAHGGTLFLDEVGDIPLTTQVKLLRVIENKKVERIGSNELIPVDFRLISATSKDLAHEILAGRFREDVFYRISTITMEIPPLRSRKEDLPALIDFFFQKSQKEHGKEIRKIDAGVKEFLLSYDYPGNIRELKNIIERSVVLSQRGEILCTDLPEMEERKGDGGRNQAIKLKEMRRHVETNYIKQVLGFCNHNITESARILGISRRQLFNKITEYKIR
ncbi:sigma-54-dependent transcriptional regulator [Candidatus Formimonas warabiya]|uniref:Stage 0 sporulation protein A homolog n=1 Tax=Formimonas warabiya TaxID=1761012 RepID=A0A3G1KZR0_FORW1|nr:sigma-54 dependent transcriptional regulator [Candidatus Formimonas warabiya]ATW27900.1 sigma-54-dependent Fis family transcriptional regulator [Candidatus Formimonas warabiya]